MEEAISSSSSISSISRKDLEDFMDNENQHFRSIRERDIFVPEGLEKKDLVDGLNWFHNSEKQRRICKYRRKLGILFKLVKKIIIFPVEGEDPTILFSCSSNINSIEMKSVIDSIFSPIPSQQIEVRTERTEIWKKIEMLEPTADTWKRIFSIESQWLFDHEIYRGFDEK